MECGQRKPETQQPAGPTFTPVDPWLAPVMWCGGHVPSIVRMSLVDIRLFPSLVDKACIPHKSRVDKHTTMFKVLAVDVSNGAALTRGSELWVKGSYGGDNVWLVDGRMHGMSTCRDTAFRIRRDTYEDSGGNVMLRPVRGQCVQTEGETRC